ncbi:hypothetical protein [Dethiobacter alkaliphilus]|uniref:Glycosyl transferase family 4 n=1 Tax=Dethiobacter alkaliphilus AHT 1 TaxID=555088 RepID=C0GE10_DETAL|nr:hypothetical protein [Dethiobacter alkaliphilus]EEG78304.1 conserved hypothetical protein [Dethiobacter alkaliphilus AHT 1]
MILFFYLVITLAATVLLLPVWADMLRLAGHLETNFRGRPIPQSMGGIFLPVFLIAAGWARWAELVSADFVDRSLIVVLGLGILGLLDDVWGDGSSKGFGGHFRRLVFNGEITTGLIKAVLGFVVALWAVTGLPGFFLLVFLRAAIVALSANLLNLLDLRPGRSLKGFFLLAFVYMVLVPAEAGVLLLLPLLLAAFVYLPWDLSGRGMMGDVGANALGGMLGLVVVLTAPSWIQALYFLLLVLAHLLAERLSFTRIIAANPFLSFLDNLGRQQWEK